MKNGFWSLPILHSRTDKKNVNLWEMAFGYFLGPLFVLSMNCVVLTYYLTFYRTYDDIVSQGTFLVLLPMLSVIPMALANIVVGIILGRFKTKQGKARPLILIAGPLLAASGIVMFVIPYLSIGFRMVWMAVTYNLCAAVASPLYSNAHSLMVSLSTRDLNQRGKLSVVANIPAVAGNGLIANIVMPSVLGWIRSAATNDVVQNRWQLVMTLFSLLAFVGCMIEYWFTRERITEEDISDNAAEPAGEIVPTGKQLTAAMGDKFWWIIMIFYFLYQAGVMFKGGYVFNIFCNDFFTDGITLFGITLDPNNIQAVLALLSGVPLAAGMLFAWPVANKIGKRNFVIVGCALSILGSIVCLINPANFVIVLIGQTIKGFSSIPGA